MEDTDELDGPLGHFSLERLKHIQDVMAAEVIKSYNQWMKSQNRLKKVTKEIDERENEGYY
jgi:capsular polysaccharide biosynthesis protein